ncbi:HPP family protein [Pseudomonas aeruginosa]
MNTESLKEKFKTIASKLKVGDKVEEIAVRDLLELFGYKRRTFASSFKIRTLLTKAGIETVPHFDFVTLDAPVSFRLISHKVLSLPSIAQSQAGHPTINLSASSEINEKDHSNTDLIYGAISEPAFLVSRLPTANIKITSIKPNSTLAEAITLMLRHDFSQLPVMTSERDVKGVISWESIAPKIIIGKKDSGLVSDYMKEHNEINITDSIFTAIPRIVENSYVLVRSSDKRISGIITTTDLSLQFRQISEPFLLLAEIENHIRSLIDGIFTKREITSIVNSSEKFRAIESVADLTFGEYIRIFENPDLWKKANLRIDKKIFTRELDKVRLIRNNIMHFDPDGISEEDHSSLHNFVKFVHTIERLTKQ